MKRILNFKKGFTLIELLITITIIAVLSAIGLIAYSNFIKNTRDAKTQSDLKQIQSALEEYFGDKKYYPVQLSSPLSFNTKTYLTQISSDYKYEQKNCDTNGVNCTSYCLSAVMENTSPHTEGTCSNPPGYNYTVTKP